MPLRGPYKELKRSMTIAEFNKDIRSSRMTHTNRCTALLVLCEGFLRGLCMVQRGGGQGRVMLCGFTIVCNKALPIDCHCTQSIDVFSLVMYSRAWGARVRAEYISQSRVCLAAGGNTHQTVATEMFALPLRAREFGPLSHTYESCA